MDTHAVRWHIECPPYAPPLTRRVPCLEQPRSRGHTDKWTSHCTTGFRGRKGLRTGTKKTYSRRRSQFHLAGHGGVTEAEKLTAGPKDGRGEDNMCPPHLRVWGHMHLGVCLGMTRDARKKCTFDSQRARALQISTGGLRLAGGILGFQFSLSWDNSLTFWAPNSVTTHLGCTLLRKRDYEIWKAFFLLWKNIYKSHHFNHF